MVDYPEGVIVKPLKENPLTKQGWSVELLRLDWEAIVKDEIKQVYLSVTYPEITRAWHRHKRGQVDYITVIKGFGEVLIKHKNKITRIPVGVDEPCLVRVPGHFWHGISNTSKRENLWTLYFLSELYDHKNPDEEREEYNE